MRNPQRLPQLDQLQACAVVDGLRVQGFGFRVWGLGLGV